MPNAEEHGRLRTHMLEMTEPKDGSSLVLINQECPLNLTTWETLLYEAIEISGLTSIAASAVLAS